MPGSALLAAAPLAAQYPGQVTRTTKKTPELRAVAVLEWTGEAGKPKTSRLVPISIYDGDQLQDAGVYMARPQPLALDPQVEYQLKEDGKTIGLFDIKNAGQEEGSWVGFGDWKGLPKPKPAVKPAKIDGDRRLERRRQARAAPQSWRGWQVEGRDSSGGVRQCAAADPDRPTLHRPSGDSSGATSSRTSAGTAPVDPTGRC